MSNQTNNILFIFDVDGTLAQSGKPASQEMITTLRNLHQNGHTLGLIGGGTFQTIHTQLIDIWDQISFACCENGQHTVGPNNTLIYQGSLRQEWGTERLTKISEALLELTASLQHLPVKTGKFIDLRSGLLYWTPIGQNCTWEDRQAFTQLDQKHNLRKGYIRQLEHDPIFDGLHLSLGGELGIAITPPGWDKSFPHFHNIVLTTDYLSSFSQVLFFGDKMGPDGSDAPMKKVPGVQCIEVQSPEHCLQLLGEQKWL